MFLGIQVFWEMTLSLDRRRFKGSKIFTFLGCFRQGRPVELF
jgi:hypothetical protein